MTVHDSMYLHLRMSKKYLMLRKDSVLVVAFQKSIITSNLDIFFFKHAAFFFNVRWTYAAIWANTILLTWLLNIIWSQAEQVP